MTDREFAMIIRAALLAIVAAIEKKWDIPPSLRRVAPT